jgi:aromatic-L-amino-acid decarboxylase
VARRTEQRRDAARTDDLSSTIAGLLPALEAFLRFEGADPAGRRSAWRATLDQPLPTRGEGADAVLDALRTILIPNGLRTGHPGFSGWVTTMPTTVAAAANLASTVTAAQRWWATPANFIEQLALRWLATLLGLPASFGGTFTGGGSTANLVCIGAARQHAAERAGIDASRDGIAGLREPRVYASTQVHHVVGRALGVLGMGRRHLVSVPLDDDGVCDVRELRRLFSADLAAGCTPVAIVASAGDVNTGRIDPITEMSDLALEHGVWLHVDGAYGGFGLLDDRVRPLYGDVSRYDSLAIDPHKWLAAPVGTGAAFVRDPDILGRAFTVEPGDYEAPRGRGASSGDLTSPFEELGEGTPDHGVDFSTPSRGIAVWAILKEIGAEGMRDRVRRHLDCARRVAELAHEHAELEVLAEPVLSICCFRFRPKGVTADRDLDALNTQIVKEVRARGRCTPSSTIVDGRFAIRPCFINARTTLEDADALVEEVLAAGRARSAKR